MNRSAKPAPLPARARVALGASIIAVAASAAFAVSAASASAPPPSEPSSSEPADDGGLELDRVALVESVLLLGRLEDTPFDRECVADVVERLPDADVLLVLADVAASAAESAGDITIPDLTLPDIELPDFTLPDIELPDFTMPDIDLPGDLTLPDIELPDIELPDFTLPDIELPVINLPQMSDEAEALSAELIYCVDGDADPDLVQQAVVAITTAPDAEEFDTACAAAVMSSFPEQLLQAIIDNNGSLMLADLPPDLSEDDVDKTFLLIACVDLEGTAG